MTTCCDVPAWSAVHVSIEILVAFGNYYYRCLVNKLSFLVLRCFFVVSLAFLSCPDAAAYIGVIVFVDLACVGDAVRIWNDAYRSFPAIASVES